MLRIRRFSSKRNELFFRTVALLLPLIGAFLALSQTAFAQNTYVITDGERVLVHTTSTTDPEAVLDEAGLALGAEDTYTTRGGDGVSEITVQRYQTVQINHCGQTLTVNAHNETVASLLSRLGIVLDENTTISASLDSLTYDGMKLTVTRVIRTTQTYTEDIPFETTNCSDPSLPAGTEIVISEGTPGEMVCTANVAYCDGVESGREIVKQIMTKQPQNQIIAVGTGSAETTNGVESVDTPESNGDAASSGDLRFTSGYPIIGSDTITTASGEVLTYTGTMSVLASAYTKTDAGCDDYTATGTLARVGAIAVDPAMIPYGTRMFIVSDDGEYVYGIATAEDCGGAIDGNRIDLYFDTTAECFEFGLRDCTVYFLG